MFFVGNGQVKGFAFLDITKGGAIDEEQALGNNQKFIVHITVLVLNSLEIGLRRCAKHPTIWTS